MEDYFLKRSSHFNAARNKDFQLWALRLEVLAETRDVSSVLFEDAIGDENFSSLY